MDAISPGTSWGTGYADPHQCSEPQDGQPFDDWGPQGDAADRSAESSAVATQGAEPLADVGDDDGPSRATTYAIAETLGGLAGLGCLATPAAPLTPLCVGAGSALGAYAAGAYLDEPTDVGEVVRAAAVGTALATVGVGAGIATAGIESAVLRVGVGSVAFGAGNNLVQGGATWVQTGDSDAAVETLLDPESALIATGAALVVGGLGVKLQQWNLQRGAAASEGAVVETPPVEVPAATVPAAAEPSFSVVAAPRPSNSLIPQSQWDAAAEVIQRELAGGKSIDPLLRPVRVVSTPGGQTLYEIQVDRAIGARGFPVRAPEGSLYFPAQGPGTPKLSLTAGDGPLPSVNPRGAWPHSESPEGNTSSWPPETPSPPGGSGIRPKTE